MSELSKTISAYADMTACPAPSCRSFWRSSARVEPKMSARTNRMAWNRLDLPEPFAPTVRDEGRGRGEGRQDGRGGREGLFSKRGGCPGRGVPTGRIWAWQRTDAVEMGLEVGGGLLPVRLEPLDDDLLDVHGAWEGVTAGCRVAICEVCPPTARAACFSSSSFRRGARREGDPRGSRGVARASTGSGRACVAPVTRAVRTASPIRAPAPSASRRRRPEFKNSDENFLLRAARHRAVGSLAVAGSRVFAPRRPPSRAPWPRLDRPRSSFPRSSRYKCSSSPARAAATMPRRSRTGSSASTPASARRCRECAKEALTSACTGRTSRDALASPGASPSPASSPTSSPRASRTTACCGRSTATS